LVVEGFLKKRRLFAAQLYSLVPSLVLALAFNLIEFGLGFQTSDPECEPGNMGTQKNRKVAFISTDRQQLVAVTYADVSLRPTDDAGQLVICPLLPAAEVSAKDDAAMAGL